MRLVVLILLAVSVPAQAAPRDVEAMVNRGRDHMAAGEYDKALAAFREAHAASPSPRTTAQVGLALQAMEDWLEAAGKLEEALRDSSDRWIAKNRGPIAKSLDTVSGHLGEVLLRLPVQRPPRMRVRIGTKDMAEIDVDKPLRVLVGPVDVQVQAPGYKTFEFRAETSPRTRVEIVVELQALPVGSTTGPPLQTAGATPMVPLPTSDKGPPVQGRSSKRLVLSVIGLGLGIGVGALGAYWLAVNGEGDCAQPPCRYNRNTRTQGWLAAGSGAVLVVGSSLYLGGSDADSPQVALVATPSQFGLAAAARF